MVALSLCSVACDGGFHARGMIFAQDRTSLSNCTIALTGPPSALMCCDTKLSPPKVDVHFTVAPSNIAYKLVLACAGFQPEERVFNGEDASPSKPLELGVIILRHSVARLRDFSVTEQAAIAKQYDPSCQYSVIPKHIPFTLWPVHQHSGMVNLRPVQDPVTRFWRHQLPSLSVGFFS
jgi:hypothetical protein